MSNQPVNAKQHAKTILRKALGDQPIIALHAVKFAWASRKRNYPEIELVHLHRFLKNEDVAIDIGASGSDWTIAMARLVGPNGRVIAYEADPYYAAVAKSTVRLAGFSRTCQIESAAIGETDGLISLAVREPNGVQRSGLQHVKPDANADDPMCIMVTRTALDTAQHRINAMARTSLIKCDIEGYELFAMRGAKNLLKMCRPAVILEIGHFERFGYSNHTLSAFMRELGYASFAMSGDGQLHATDSNLECAESSPNRIFVHASRFSNFPELVNLPLTR